MAKQKAKQRQNNKYFNNFEALSKVAQMINKTIRIILFIRNVLKQGEMACKTFGEAHRESKTKRD